ncbi:unnamed protein product, partial [Oppiella nova]
MAGCLDNIQIRRPEWLELGEKRNAIASIAAGTAVCHRLWPHDDSGDDNDELIPFFTGWWIIIDISARYTEGNDFYNAFHVCGVLGTLSLFMINAVSNGHIRGDAYGSGVFGQTAARIWLFIGFV